MTLQWLVPSAWPFSTLCYVRLSTALTGTLQPSRTGRGKWDNVFLFFLVNVFISEKGSYNYCAVFYPYQHKHFGMLSDWV